MEVKQDQIKKAGAPKNDKIAIFLAAIILSVAKLIEISIRKRSARQYQRYNLIHLTRLLSIIVVSVLIISFIIIRNPYRIGDHIQIDTFRRDAIEIGYVDTTLWEFAGDSLTNDLPSGRLIRFPNSLVLQSAVFNYS